MCINGGIASIRLYTLSLAVQNAPWFATRERHISRTVFFQWGCQSCGFLLSLGFQIIQWNDYLFSFMYLYTYVTYVDMFWLEWWRTEGQLLCWCFLCGTFVACLPETRLFFRIWRSPCRRVGKSPSRSCKREMGTTVAIESPPKMPFGWWWWWWWWWWWGWWWWGWWWWWWWWRGEGRMPDAWWSGCCWWWCLMPDSCLISDAWWCLPHKGNTIYILINFIFCYLDFNGSCRWRHGHGFSSKRCDHRFDSAEQWYPWPDEFDKWMFSWLRPVFANTFHQCWEYMSNCIYLLWWKEDVASSRVWGNVGFTCKNEIKRRWGDSKNEIGFDVHHIYEHIDVKDWKMRPIMVEKCQNLRNEIKTIWGNSVNLLYWGHRTNKSRRSYSFFPLEVEWNIVMNMVMKRDMLFESDCSYFAMIGFLDSTTSFKNVFFQLASGESTVFQRLTHGLLHDSDI